MEPKNQVIWTTRCKVMAKDFNIFRYIYYEKLVFSGLPKGISKTKIVSWLICIGLLLAFVLNGSERRNTPKMVLSENVIFRALRLSLGHFGQQVPLSPVSQLQHGVSQSSLPPFIVDLLAFNVYPRSNSFLQWEFQRVLNGWFYKRITIGRNSSDISSNNIWTTQVK